MTPLQALREETKAARKFAATAYPGTNTIRGPIPAGESPHLAVAALDRYFEAIEARLGRVEELLEQIADVRGANP